MFLCVDCTGGKEWQECGTACPLTCDNYDELQICTLQCVQGCFCPGGTVERNGTTCVTTDQCSESTCKSFSCMGVLQYIKYVMCSFGLHTYDTCMLLYIAVDSRAPSPGAMVGVVIALSITCAALVIGH